MKRQSQLSLGQKFATDTFPRDPRGKRPTPEDLSNPPKINWELKR